ncbi:MAG: UvrD-helicase domain-containing protein [Cardiobacteriaceae bacterium]|nr:UvrD-helicase domain-containing protein [Cardiobacteriaceae bacterium]
MTTPATDLPLTGHALIEASAGTGKTWTLTGILLRLLIEAGHEPRHIVATTFTRAAATEMRQRIYARVDSFRALLLAIIQAYGDDPALLADDDALIPRLFAHLDSLPASKDAPHSDAINRHILHHVLEEQGLDGLIHAYRQTLLAGQTLDQLFIGTLDSLCQRWLHELALESGIDTIRINTEPNAIAQLTHDHLRRYYQEQAQTDAARFAAFYAQAPSPADHLSAAKTALNYGSAPFVAMPPPPFDPAARAAALHTLASFTSADLADAQATIAAAVAADYLTAKRALVLHAHALPDAVSALIQQQAPDETAEKWLAGLAKTMQSAASGADPFKKKADLAARQALTAHPILAAIHAADNARLAFADVLAHMQAQSLAGSSDHVRQHLAAALRQSGETTYSELLARLNAILADKPALAAYLAHRYPVILVDESQDLNHEQAELIRRIYLQPHHSGFCLLVGDPKQAIYRFRGSDVANYTTLKDRIPHHASLEHNFRSAPALIAALNAAYQHPDIATLGENIAYQPMQAANAERPLVLRDGSAIAHPLQTLAVQATADAPLAIRDLIRHLTSAQSQWLRRGNGGLTRLEPRDIMVLAHSNRSLQTIETVLHQAGIACEREADSSLFAQSVAHEMQWLLAAILEPADSAVVRRLLAGKFYGFDLATLDTLASTPEFAAFHARLGEAGQRWAQSGLLAALQTLWRHDPWPGNIWTRLASQPHPHHLRDLLDLRRLQEIIAAHEQPPRRFLDWWQRQLAEPPTAEWALALPLPGSNAVRLMTIHKSKGLQAPVVILASMREQKTPQAHDVHAFHRDGALWLATGNSDDDSRARIATENDAEARRLLYVALTRAEDLLFIAQRKQPPAVLKRWQESAAPHLHTLDLAAMESSLPEPVTFAAPPPATPPLRLAPLPPQHKRGWRKTSFTALARNIPAALEDTAIHTSLDLELAQEWRDSADPPADTLPIAFAFPRGPQAGSFLHEALEKIRPERRPHWPHFFRTLLDKHHLDAEQERIPDLADWFARILAAPLASGIPLARIDDSERELGFSLALDARQPLPHTALAQHFAAWGKALPAARDTALYRYLRGEIDLVYAHAGRYHIVDYKSNHLGNHPDDYHANAMRQTMDDHHYWLQAAIYQLALHRLLKQRLPGYCPQAHLGNVEYYFIRSPENGHLGIDIPTDWLLHLDEILSKNHPK